ncbi:MAG: hypothetical protein BWX71_02676 [Deltaproteobacteria bacterium ADurb.Bin072]|nr:MAG: hypothetical protein BWX71_02676 [Deltaproteobacteria bacterium ADurb.Bin072]
MKKERTLIISLAALVVGIIAMVSTLQAFTNAVEYKEFTTTGASSTAGTTFQGDVLVCAYLPTGGSFSGTVKIQLYHTLGDGSGEWIDTGDQFTGEGCKVLEVPENGVKLRAYATVSSGSIRVRMSQEYPPRVRTQGGK